MHWLTWSGSVRFDPEVDASLLAPHLGRCLRDVDANDVQVDGETVSFEGGLFRFVTSWNVLVPFGFGDLRVESEAREVRYNLSYRQSIVCSAPCWGVLGSLMLSFGVRGIPGGVLGFTALWSVVALIGLAIGLARFNSFVTRAVDTAPRAVASSAQPKA